MTAMVITENTSGGTHTGVADTYLRESTPTTNYVSAALEVFNYAASGTDHGNILLAITLPAALIGATINSASLDLYVIDVQQGTTPVYAVHQCLRAFTASGATWNTYDGSNSWGTAGGTNATDIGSSVLTNNSTSGIGAYRSLSGAGLATLVGTEAASGILRLLIKRDGTGYTNVGDATYIQYASSEGTDGQRPKLTLDYTAGVAGSPSAPPAIAFARIRSILNH